MNHPTAPIARPAFLSVLLAAALAPLGGCMLPSDQDVLAADRDVDQIGTPSDQEAGSETPVYEFGAGYRLVVNDGMPLLQGDSLHVDLGYDCSRAAFTLEHFKTADTAYEVWLNMPLSQVRPQCAVPIVERHAFKLPAAIAAAQSVVLVAPDLERIELKAQAL